MPCWAQRRLESQSTASTSSSFTDPSDIALPGLQPLPITHLGSTCTHTMHWEPTHTHTHTQHSFLYCIKTGLWKLTTLLVFNILYWHPKESTYTSFSLNKTLVTIVFSTAWTTEHVLSSPPQEYTVNTERQKRGCRICCKECKSREGIFFCNLI